jgi:hypothetical protein
MGEMRNVYAQNLVMETSFGVHQSSFLIMWMGEKLSTAPMRPFVMLLDMPDMTAKHFDFWKYLIQCPWLSPWQYAHFNVQSRWADVTWSFQDARSITCVWLIALCVIAKYKLARKKKAVRRSKRTARMLFNDATSTILSRDSVVDIATGYGLDESR